MVNGVIVWYSLYVVRNQSGEFVFSMIVCSRVGFMLISVVVLMIVI